MSDKNDIRSLHNKAGFRFENVNPGERAMATCYLCHREFVQRSYEFAVAAMDAHMEERHGRKHLSAMY